MSTQFFADYKKYIVIPVEKPEFSKKSFDPREYASHYILTLSIFEPVICNWTQASKHEIDVKKSIEDVLTVFNQKHYGQFHLELLEIVEDKTYFVVALSVKNTVEPQQAEFEISNIVDKMISNPFYIGQSWYKLTSEKGRVERKLFSFSFKEYAFNRQAEK
ncbi:hypothetical protein SAMN05192533_11072 [Mesobacillus persicus]|uniref:Uncharacterized protein n=1 Tax=Mesobacillus persicus TaxID=930146 RepID=A0A1H8ERB7_9BACI|nr:hypothetical protein [Mesobacillus persicus]SEN21916.1 hypothetical protein SAMN05192533_11072 [Mesobacillus persicus]